MNAIRPANFLLPNSAGSQQIDLQKWAVIACDQHSANPEYWHSLEDFVGDYPSTLQLIYPEVYLEEDSKKAEKRLAKIHNLMKTFLENDFFTTYKNCGVFLERRTSTGRTRRSLLVELDLEEYSYINPETAQVRPSEATVAERIPPRLKVRQNAALETSHVQLIFNDPNHTVFVPINNRTAELEKLYDFDLNMGGGHLTGYALPETNPIWQEIRQNLAKLQEKQNYQFLVGDGNHSLATAKAHWENLKSKGANLQHSARYTLVELINLHDSGLDFEPIHRLLMHTEINDFIAYANSYFSTKDSEQNCTEVEVFSAEDHYTISVPHGKDLAINVLQKMLDSFMTTYHLDHPEYLEYIHDETEIRRLANQQNNIGIIAPPLSRHSLFPYVEQFGATARKTFSLGSGLDKRYYLETRKLLD